MSIYREIRPYSYEHQYTFLGELIPQHFLNHVKASRMTIVRSICFVRPTMELQESQILIITIIVLLGGVFTCCMSID